jgi:molybdopterin/thiamine biosynthesis adenylyltransferase
MRRMDLDFTDAELHRYSRHILLQEVGGTGQARLRAAKVLVVGAAALARPWACTWPAPASALSA